MHRSTSIAIVLLLCAACAGCGDDPVAPVAVTFPATNVSFNGHVKPVLQYSCAFGGCHDGYSSNPANPSTIIFALQSYNDVLNAGIISTSQPERSRLAQVLRGELLHPRDPYFDALTQNQRDGIVQWIREGALNN
jgi:hypothetical protein